MQQMAKQRATKSLEIALVLKKKVQEGRVGYAGGGSFRNFQKKLILIIYSVPSGAKPCWELIRYMWG